MPPAELHVIGIDPGITTGWALLTVPRKSVYGNEPSKILDWRYGQITGPENAQVREIVKLAKTTQGMAFAVGPALVVENWEMRTHVTGTTNSDLLSPVRIAAKLDYAMELGLMDDCQIVYQTAAMAKSTATDDRLKAWDFWIPGMDHARDATRHAITALRRAKDNVEFRNEMWADPNRPIRSQIRGRLYR